MCMLMMRFGVLIDQAGVTENHYLYTGEQFDPGAGYYYLRARYMDPGMGEVCYYGSISRADA